MAEILPTASYVRRRSTPEDAQVLESLDSDQGAKDIPQRVWKLLETPQTVESLCRSLASQYGETERCDREVRVVLEKLYREDLIQISPDS